jgi:hypothetical protein
MAETTGYPRNRARAVMGKHESVRACWRWDFAARLGGLDVVSGALDLMELSL